MKFLPFAFALVIFWITQNVQASPLTEKAFRSRPKLVVVLVVDQFRADYLTRFQSRFLPAKSKNGGVGGYSYLMSQGAYFPFAQYDVLQCMTGPGHAMILSGSYPYQMGIPLNGWFDLNEQAPKYCVQDMASPIVGAPSKMGVSPRSFKGDTVGDELKNAGYPSKVVSIALKDRAAILLGGHRADVAMWIDPASFHWVSSQFYFPDMKLPSWIGELNTELDAIKGKSFKFKPEGKPTGLSLEGPSFNHEAKIGTRESLSSPLGLEITVNAASHAVKKLTLGRGLATDLLAVSFSSHDYQGHLVGPNASEMEEMTVAEDRQISRLLNDIRKALPGGLKDVVVVLTADHGMPPHPAWLSKNRIESGRIDEAEVVKKADEVLDGKFGKPKAGSWFSYHAEFNFWLNAAAIAEKGTSREAVEALAKQEIQKFPGVAFVFTQEDYRQKRLPPVMFERQINKTFVPSINGDLVLIPRPFFMVKEEGLTHLTSYSYDRSVPLAIVGDRVRPGVYSTQVDIIDLAPTLSYLLGILAPSTSEGRVLSEIFGN